MPNTRKGGFDFYRRFAVKKLGDGISRKAVTTMARTRKLRTSGSPRPPSRFGATALFEPLLKRMETPPELKNNLGELGKKACKSVEKEQSREKYPRWSWARTQMGNPD
jgi:hypothetical protein